MKKILQFSIGISIVLFVTCRPDQKQNEIYQHLQGKAMGTTYSVKYKGAVNHQKAIDSLLATFNASLSTYDATSTISKFNLSDTGICYHTSEDRFFYHSLTEAIRISKLSNGSFDPTVAPLVNYYGFGYVKKEKPTETSQKTLDSLLLLVGIEKVAIEKRGDSVCIKKLYKNIKLDLNASAPGHGVDEIAALLTSKGIVDYMIEIGGEVKAKGKNAQGKLWAIGINTPVEGVESNDVLLPVCLNNQALATSGNYRNFFDNGKIKLAHIIDPKTGLAQPSDILSATIIADDCLTADAMATACIVKGLEKAKSFIAQQNKIEAFFIYKPIDKDTLLYYQTPGFLKYNTQ